MAGRSGRTSKRKLTPRQTAVLAAVERLGRPGMLELSPEFDFAPSEVARVLEVLEERGLIARSGDPALVYTGGVRFWATARGGEQATESLQALLDELTRGEQDLDGWISPEQRCIVVYLPLRSIEQDLFRGHDSRYALLGDRIRELVADGRLAAVEVAANVTAQRGEPALEVSLAPPPAPRRDGARRPLYD
jgi:DNA-binding MarR family transcriptional regulator